MHHLQGVHRLQPLEEILCEIGVFFGEVHLAELHGELDPVVVADEIVAEDSFHLRAESQDGGDLIKQVFLEDGVQVGSVCQSVFPFDALRFDRVLLPSSPSKEDVRKAAFRQFLAFELRNWLVDLEQADGSGKVAYPHKEHDGVALLFLDQFADPIGKALNEGDAMAVEFLDHGFYPLAFHGKHAAEILSEELGFLLEGFSRVGFELRVGLKYRLMHFFV